MEKKERLLQRIKEGIFDVGYIWRKETITVLKDEGVLIFCILVPLLYPILYSWCYNNEVVRDVPVAIVDQSHSQLSREFARGVDASPDVSVQYYCSDMEEAKRLVGKQKVYGILLVPADFSTRLNRMEQATVSVYCNMGFLLYYKAIYQTATSVTGKMNKHIQVSLSGNPTNREDEVGTQPLAFEEVPLFNSAGGYGSFIIPGVLMLVLQQTLLLGIGLAAGTARERNRYRDLVPVSRHYNGIFRIVFGKSLSYILVYAVLAAFEVLVIPRLFHFVHIANPYALLGIMVPFILACVFFGMFISCIIRYRENVLLIIVFTSVPFLFLSGVSWPTSSIPSFWKGVANLIPSTFGIRAFVRVNSMGATLGDVRMEYDAMWCQVLFYFFLTCLVYRYQIITARRHAIDRMNEIKATMRKSVKGASVKI
ncbi:MAG: ABC transporter permease [Prevotella sp.]|nr:ABC transporter permease [Prevotella sp.]